MRERRQRNKTLREKFEDGKNEERKITADGNGEEKVGNNKLVVCHEVVSN
jgi:hypothetical protein